MRVLNWVEQPGLQLQAQQRELVCLDLSLSEDRRVEFLAALQWLREGLGQRQWEQEVRLDLPSGWRIYLKGRSDQESRLLLARPAVGEWVGTLALSVAAFEAWLEAISGGRAGFQGALTELIQGHGSAGRIWRMSNFDLRIQRLPG